MIVALVMILVIWVMGIVFIMGHKGEITWKIVYWPIDLLMKAILATKDVLVNVKKKLAAKPKPKAVNKSSPDCRKKKEDSDMPSAKDDKPSPEENAQNSVTPPVELVTQVSPPVTPEASAAAVSEVNVTIVTTPAKQPETPKPEKTKATTKKPRAKDSRKKNAEASKFLRPLTRPKIAIAACLVIAMVLVLLASIMHYKSETVVVQVPQQSGNNIAVVNPPLSPTNATEVVAIPKPLTQTGQAVANAPVTTTESAPVVINPVPITVTEKIIIVKEVPEDVKKAIDGLETRVEHDEDLEKIEKQLNSQVNRIMWLEKSKFYFLIGANQRKAGEAKITSTTLNQSWSDSLGTSKSLDLETGLAPLPKLAPNLYLNIAWCQERWERDLNFNVNLLGGIAYRDQSEVDLQVLSFGPHYKVGIFKWLSASAGGGYTKNQVNATGSVTCWDSRFPTYGIPQSDSANESASGKYWKIGLDVKVSDNINLLLGFRRDSLQDIEFERPDIASAWEMELGGSTGTVSLGFKF